MSHRSKLIAGACALVSIGLAHRVHALTFTVDQGSFGTDTARYNAAVGAMTAVVNRYNAYGDFNWGNDGNIEVFYNAGVPTAQANPGGSITFGGTYPNERVSLHESDHWMGTVYGHDPNGPRAVAVLEQFDGIGARFGTDGTHFWGYGMNYDSEFSEIAAQRNIAIVYAFRRDWGIGNPNDPSAWAATSVSLGGSDAAGESGFNYASKWSDHTFAHPNADYSTGAFDLRTPQGYPSWKFAGKSLTVNAGGRLLFNGWGADGQVIMNDLRLAGGTVRHDQFSQDVFQLAGNVTLQPGTTSTFEAAQGNIRVLAAITGGGSVNFTGPNTITLAAANTFTGAATVNAGTVVLDGASSSIGTVAVSNGGTLRVKSRGINSPTLTANALTVGAVGTGVLTLDANGQSSLTAAFLNAGAFNVNAGGTVSVVNGGLLGVGQYPAIGYTTRGGTGSLPAGMFNIGGRTIAQWLDNGAGLLSLNVVGNDRPVWTGRDSGSWTTSNTGLLKNWKLESDGTGTDYLVGDNVLFDDSAAGSTTVSINSGNVSPVAVTFNNAAKSYTLNGSAGITGAASVTKNGAGTVTLSTSNSYTGRTTVNGGVLAISANNNLGANAAPVTLNGGTLRTTTGLENTHPVAVGANGGTIQVGSNGQLFFNTANTLTGSGPLTVTGTGALPTVTGWTGNLRIGQSNSYSGAITLTSGGIFEYGAAGAVASGATFTIGNQGELAVQGGANTALPNAVTVSGGANSVLSFENGDGGEVTGGVTLNAGLTVAMRDWYSFGNVRSGKISGKVTGPGALSVNAGTGSGTGVLTVTNLNTYTGGTNINARTAVVVGATGALGTGTVTLNSGGLRSTWNSTTSEPTITNPVVVNGASAIEGSTGTLFRVSGDLSGSGTLDLSANFNGSGLRLAGNNANYTGTATVSKANTRLGSTSAGSAAAAWVVNGNLQTDVVGGGTFDLGSLSGYGVISGHANNAGNALSTLRVGGRNTDSTFNGRIVNNALNDAQTGNADGAKNNVLALTKVGQGTLTLGGNNAYTGATTIEGGTLRLANQTVAGLAVANYTFDSVAGTTVNNAGGGGAAMNGTLSNGATVVGGGKSGNALSVANGAYVNVASGIADLSNNTTWTVSAWVKTATAGSTILAKSDGGWGNGNTIFYLGDGSAGGSGGTPSAVRWAGGFFQTTANSTPVNDNAWHLVTYVNNAGSYAIYTDGVLQALSAGNAGFSNADVGGNVRIGATTNTGDGALNFNGLLDNVQVFNQALSAEQVAAIVSGTAVGPLPTTTPVSISSGATFDVNGVTQQIASLNAPAGASLQLGNGQLVINGTANSTCAGTVSGVGGSIVKQGNGILTLSGVGTHTGPTVVSAGTLVLAATDAASKSPVAVNGGKLSLGVSGAGAVVVPSLTIAGTGSVDLGNDALVLDYAAGDTATLPNAVANIVAKRITSSLLTGNSAMTIGFARSADLDGVFRGVTLDGDAMVVMATLYGDADLDGGVSINDFNALAGNFGVSTGKVWTEGDFDYDGGVSINDFNLLAGSFGQSLPASSEMWAGLLAFAAAHNDLAAFEAVTGVPEPTSLGLLTAAGVVGLRRRRRTR